VGGVVDRRFGILTTPGHKGVPVGIVQGMDWAADNQAYTQGFEPDTFFPWLDSMLPYRARCLFVPVPDVVGDALATLESFRQWHQHFIGWPVAFVAQDGQEGFDLPSAENWDTLFIGGTTDWKPGPGALSCIQQAQALNKHIHIGRVNWYRRYWHFASLPGSETWTCDGTRTRFDGTAKTVSAWADYMIRPRQKRMGLVPGKD
jgi:hypothetical protein